MAPSARIIEAPAGAPYAYALERAGVILAYRAERAELEALARYLGACELNSARRELARELARLERARERALQRFEALRLEGEALGSVSETASETASY
jgi:hypothetical protein